MSDTYIIKSGKKNHWSITKFSDYKEPDSTYEVSERGGNYYCSCPGFHRQKKKRFAKLTELVSILIIFQRLQTLV